MLAATLAVAPGDAAAWGTVGHRAVGEVADRLLTPAAKRAVADLLADDLDANGQPSGRTTLADVASWADEIRGTPASQPPWHYDNLPACGAIADEATWCPDGQCATHQIEAQAALLADAGQPPRLRNEALKWLVHLVGDLHQPLHAATNRYAPGVLDAKGENSDRGGNDVPVVLVGARRQAALLELHGLWDRQLVEVALGSRNGAVPEAAGDRLIALARKVPAAQLAFAPSTWARQSNAAARRSAYGYDGFVCRQPHDEAVAIGALYQKAAERLVREQLALAGARLARLLNEKLATAR